jgi:hypothetical protein
MDPINASSEISPDKFAEGWRKFVKGTPPKVLREFLANHAADWFEVSELPNKLKKGDVFIYIGRAGEPNCAVRIFNDLVDEVFSTAFNWESDPEASILIDELAQNLPGYERFKETSADLRQLKSIEAKIHSDDNSFRELNSTELAFIYQLDRKVRFFGQSSDYQLTNILSTRDRYADFATIFNCSREEVTFLKSEINENTRVYCGGLDSADWKVLSNRQSRLMVVGDVVFNNCHHLERLPDGLHIHGRASFKSCHNLREIGNYVVFRGDANFTGATTLSAFGKGVEYLGKADFSDCVSIRDYPADVIFAASSDFSGTSISRIPFGEVFLENISFARTPIVKIPKDTQFHGRVSFEGSALEYISEGVVFKGKANFKDCLNLKEFHPTVRFLQSVSFESSGLHSIPEAAQFFDDVDFSSCSNLERIPELTRFYGVARFANSGIKRVDNDVKFYGPVMLKSCSKLEAIADGVCFYGPVHIKNCPSLRTK